MFFALSRDGFSVRRRDWCGDYYGSADQIGVALSGVEKGADAGKAYVTSSVSIPELGRGA